MNKEKIDNEHLDSLEVFMKHHYIADNGHYQWVKKRFKELQQKVKQLESTLNEVREECETNIRMFDSGKSYSIAVRDTSKDILKILDKVGGSNE